MMWKATYLRNLSEALSVEQYAPFPRAPSVFLKNLMGALETLYDKNQPRAKDGKWTATGSGSAKGQEGVDKASQRKNKDYVAKANEWLDNYQKARSSYEISSHVANTDLDNFLEFVGISKEAYARTHDLLEKHTREHTQEDADAALENHWSNQDEVVGVLRALDVLERGQFEFERQVEIGRVQEKIDTLDTKWAPDRIFPDGKNLHPDFGNREKGMPSSYDITSIFDGGSTASGSWSLTQGDPNAGYESYVEDFNKRRADFVEQRGRAEETSKYIYRKVRASGEPLVQSWTTSSSGANTQGGEEGWNIAPNAKMDLSTNKDVLVVSGFARYRGYQAENEVIVIDPSKAPRSYKYTRRWKGPNGEWQYEYPNELLKNIEEALETLYDKNQPRAADGKWTKVGSGGDSSGGERERRAWKKAGTLEEAQKQLASMGIKKIAFVDVSDALALRQVNNVGEVVSDVMNLSLGFQQRIVASTNKFTLEIKGDEKWLIGETTKSKFAGQWDPEEQILHLPGGSDFAKKVGPLKLGLEESTVGGGKDLRATIAHELAHWVDDQVLSSVERGRWKQIHDGLGRLGRMKGISRYADWDFHESFAESFSAWSHPRYGDVKSARLPKEVESFFTEAFGKRAPVKYTRRWKGADGEWQYEYP